MGTPRLADNELSYWTSCSQTVYPRLVAVLRARDGGICGVCLAPLGDETPMVDHIIPTGRSGSSGEQWNLRLVHRACNHFNSTQELWERREAAKANRRLAGDFRTDAELLDALRARARRGRRRAA